MIPSTELIKIDLAFNTVLHSSTARHSSTVNASKYTFILTADYLEHPSPYFFKLLRANSLQRSKPFNLHSFFDSQISKVKMGTDPEKDRVSAEIDRHGQSSPILPTVNPNLERSEPPSKASSKIHPAFFVT